MRNGGAAGWLAVLDRQNELPYDGKRNGSPAELVTTRSAGKAHRRSLARKDRNRAVKTFTRNRVKQGITVLDSGDQLAATEAVRLAVSALDSAARKGVYHANKAARQKSRLLRRLNAAVVAAPKAKAPKAAAPKAAAPKAKAPARRPRTLKT